MRHLRGRPERQCPFAGVIRRDDGARLDRHRRQPLVDDPLFDHAIGAAERLVDVAAAHRVRIRDVRAQIGMRQRRSRLDRRLRIHDDRQRIVIDIDGIDGIARDVRVGRDGHCHGVTDEIHPVAGEHGVLRRLEVRNRRGARNQTAGGVDVGTRQDGDDTGNGARRRDVDAGDAGVRMRAAKDDGVQEAGEPQVVDVGGEAFDEPRVLDALHRAADVGRADRVSHGPPPCFSRPVRRRR